jgi:demethylmenaquinone methyltransferase/2-methoxy-6-polyprenyl-1,4-benzoquinol methylase
MRADIARVKRSKEQARSSYNRMSRFYDVLTAHSERRPTQAGIAMLGARRGERILEIGPGTGRAILSLAAAVGDPGGVYGLDVSEGMLEVARRKLEKRGLEARVVLSRGDATELPYDDCCFDAIFSSFTLELFDTPEIPVVLAECRRVLKQGGRLTVVSMSDRDMAGAATRMYLRAHELWPSFVDCRPIGARGFLEQAGFNYLASMGLSMWGLPVDVVLAVKTAT